MDSTNPSHQSHSKEDTISLFETQQNSPKYFQPLSFIIAYGPQPHLDPWIRGADPTASTERWLAPLHAQEDNIPTTTDRSNTTHREQRTLPCPVHSGEPPPSPRKRSAHYGATSPRVVNSLSSAETSTLPSYLSCRWLGHCLCRHPQGNNAIITPPSAHFSGVPSHWCDRSGISRGACGGSAITTTQPPHEHHGRPMTAHRSDVSTPTQFFVVLPDSTRSAGHDVLKCKSGIHVLRWVQMILPFACCVHNLS